MNHISNPLRSFMNDLSIKTFGRSREDCWEKGLCVCCGQAAKPRCHSEAGHREYEISCMCEECFDQLT